MSPESFPVAHRQVTCVSGPVLVFDGGPTGLLPEPPVLLLQHLQIHTAVVVSLGVAAGLGAHADRMGYLAPAG